MNDLVEWLREQIAETLYHADRGYLHSPIEPPGGSWRPTTAGELPNLDRLSVVRLPPAVQPLIIAQVEAHTAILDAHPHLIRPEIPGDWGTSEGCHTCDFRDGVQAYYGWCDTVRALALAYQHSTGYHEEWRP